MKEKINDFKNKDYSFTIIVTFVCLTIIGFSLIPMLSVKLNPTRTLPGFTIRYQMPKASSRFIEKEVTSKLESTLARLSGIKEISSESSNGSGAINIEADKHVNLQMLRFQVSTTLRQVWSDLPDGVRYPVIEMKSPNNKDLSPFMVFTINGSANPIEIQNFTEEKIKNVLSNIDGIYKVEVTGATPMEWRLEYDSDQLNHLGLHLSTIESAIQTYYSKENLGICQIHKEAGENQWLRLSLLHTDKKKDHFNAQDIFVENCAGKLICLDQLVKVSYQEEEPQSYYRINGENSIYLSVTADKLANQLRLHDQIMEKIQKIQLILPPSYKLRVSYDATNYIRDELNKIYFRTGLTVLVLLLFVFLFSFNIRYLFLVVTSLIVNIAVAIIFYNLFNLEIQLYSLAGITISLNLIIDSTIVMTDHYVRKRNRRVFIALLAATLTTIGALSVIFFLEDEIRLNLQDFATAVIINLMTSLFVALFFVPALINRVQLDKNSRKLSVEKWKSPVLAKLKYYYQSFSVFFNRFYSGFIRIACKHRAIFFLVFLLAFGTPIFMLPKEMKSDTDFAHFYNKTIGSSTYQKKVKPVADKLLGGTLRLFVQNVYDGSYFVDNKEVLLRVNAWLPKGATLQQMNSLMKQVESFLSQYNELKQFQTSIYNANEGMINIYFKKRYAKTSFPPLLRAKLITKCSQLGAGTWTIKGLHMMGFSNETSEGAGGYIVNLYGYNYDELYDYASQLKKKLLKHIRIKEVVIKSKSSYQKANYQEFYFKLNKHNLIRNNTSVNEVFSAYQPIYGSSFNSLKIDNKGKMERINLFSKQSKTYDAWAMNNVPLTLKQNTFQLSDLAELKKDKVPQEIAKINQQYRLCVQYDYIGRDKQGKKSLKKDLKAFNKILPMGYSAEKQEYYRMNFSDDYEQYLLLILIAFVIYLLTSILFNSLKQPLAIIFVIPISYIGVFLTFYCFDLKFDQGGFASFILLCGITVNASIYIINEFNNVKKQYPLLSDLKAYLRAFRVKKIPIFLTVVSTILGFIPFMVGTNKEAFWFPLAAGTVGGLLMSIVGIIFFLPIMTVKFKHKPK